MAHFSPDMALYPELAVSSARRLCAGLLVTFAAVVAVACDGGDTRARIDDSRNALFADSSQGTTSLGNHRTTAALTLSNQLVGTSAEGDEADLRVRWRMNDAVIAAVRDATRVVVKLDTAPGEQHVLLRQSLEDGVTEGELDVVVPTTGDVEAITVGLEGLAEGVVDDLQHYATLALPRVLSAEDTPLEHITTLHAHLVPNSYQTSIANGRRLHRFAVRVEADLDGSAPALSSDAAAQNAGTVSVTGLEKATSQHFVAFEDGFNDPESPVTAVYEQEPVTVFLVMDVSSSISLAGAADDLLDAVSATLLNLAPVARFDLRVFASDVFEINSLRDLVFDDLTDSGTAFYRALDTALDDAEAVAGDVVLIGFTDGRDFASRNFYPAFLSHEQVLEYVLNRLHYVGQARRAQAGARFESHFVSLGSDIDSIALQRLAEAGQGSYFASYTNDTVKDAFSHLTRGVRGLYQLEYSSQQQAGDAPLVLQVQANDVTSNPVELPTRAGLAPPD